MSNFDIEQCEKDGGLAIHKQYGEIKIIVFEKDPDGYYVARKTEDLRYYIVSDGNLTNIPKKKKITIYVYKNSHGAIFISQSNKSYTNCKLIKTIEEEIEI
ncbi:MAG: hypothetical protein IM592_11295 [Bacteroidetes bacterium]|nr:hypothetical protein [Bacteroidota bacterium]